VAVNGRVWPTLIEAGDGVTAIDVNTATPVPLIAAVCGLVTALSDTLNWPLRVPAAVGENVTATEQDFPAAKVAGKLPQLLV
jgi:hypothetical protein